MNTAQRIPHNTELILFTKSVHNKCPQSVHKECPQHAVVFIFGACADSIPHHTESLRSQSCNVEAIQRQLHPQDSENVSNCFWLVLKNLLWLTQMCPKIKLFLSIRIVNQWRPDKANSSWMGRWWGAGFTWTYVVSLGLTWTYMRSQPGIEQSSL